MDFYRFIGEDIDKLVAVLHNLFIAARIHVERLVGAVHQHDATAVAHLTLIHIKEVAWHEMLHLAFSDSHIVFAPFQQITEESERLVLLRRASLSNKEVMLIAGESPGHIQSHFSIASFFGAVHEEFGAIIDLRNATRSEQEGDSLLPLV